MPSLTSGVPNEEGAAISPKLWITMVGCFLAFLSITIGFILVARYKKRSASSVSSPVSAPVMSKEHRCPIPNHTTCRGIFLPVASDSRCFACSPRPGYTIGASRASYESLQSIAPLPRYTRYAPTGASIIRSESWRSSAFSTPLSTVSPATPSTPPSPSPAYMVRAGPTASFHRAVY